MRIVTMETINAAMFVFAISLKTAIIVCEQKCKTKDEMEINLILGGYFFNWNTFDFQLLTRITLKWPLCFGNFSPKRSFICDTRTCTAAPVVNPLTNGSLNKELMTPN